MAYLALRERCPSQDTAPAPLPAHHYDHRVGLNVVDDSGAVLVEAADGAMFGFTITNHPPPIGAKKDDD